MSERRVVVTGIGTVNPLGCNVETSWKRLINSESGIERITHFDVSEEPESISKVAGQVKEGEGEGELNIDNFIDKKEQRKMDRFVQFSLIASEEAVKDSGLNPETDEEKSRIGVLIGSGIGGLTTIENTAKTMFERGMKKISPFFIPASLINLTSGHVSIKYGFMGPNHSVVTACATGTHAIGDSFRMIFKGDADAIVCGGAEAAICKLGVGGFSAMHALSTQYNDDPKHASRPWDKDRDGFVMGEGSGVLVLEEYEHAKKRGAKIYCEIVGYGLSGDAYHMSAPEETGRGAKKAMRMALDDAKMTSKDVDYINAHGTSTPLGDMIEFNAVKEVFAENLDGICMSSTKSATGHLLGAAGAVEAIFSIMAMKDGIVPPTLNLDSPSEGCEAIDLVPFKAKRKELKVCLSNSFGFGGTNASVIFKKI